MVLEAHGEVPTSLEQWEPFLFWTLRATYLFAKNPDLFYSLKLSRQDSFGTPAGVRLSFLYPSPMRGPACHILAGARASGQDAARPTAVACKKIQKSPPPGG